MQEIPLKGGWFTIVDDEDYEKLSAHKWHIRRGPNLFYAVSYFDGKLQLMHRIILNPPRGLEVDHINSNGLDNRKSNMRICTTAENQRNQRPQSGRTSLYKGVAWKSDRKKWRAQIQIPPRKTLWLGAFQSEKDAALAYDRAAKEHFGEFAHLNFT